VVYRVRAKEREVHCVRRAPSRSTESGTNTRTPCERDVGEKPPGWAEEVLGNRELLWVVLGR
jgi:hypothetical protein